MSVNQTIDRLLRSWCDKRWLNSSELNKTDKFNHKQDEKNAESNKKKMMTFLDCVPSLKSFYFCFPFYEIN